MIMVWFASDVTFSVASDETFCVCGKTFCVVSDETFRVVSDETFCVTPDTAVLGGSVVDVGRVDVLVVGTAVWLCTRLLAS